MATNKSRTLSTSDHKKKSRFLQKKFFFECYTYKNSGDGSGISKDQLTVVISHLAHGTHDRAEVDRILGRRIGFLSAVSEIGILLLFVGLWKFHYHRLNFYSFIDRVLGIIFSSILCWKLEKSILGNKIQVLLDKCMIQSHHKLSLENISGFSHQQNILQIKNLF